jgi:hypothetical protein
LFPPIGVFGSGIDCFGDAFAGEPAGDCANYCAHSGADWPADGSADGCSRRATAGRANPDADGMRSGRTGNGIRVRILRSFTFISIWHSILQLNFGFSSRSESASAHASAVE